MIDGQSFHKCLVEEKKRRSKIIYQILSFAYFIFILFFFAYIFDTVLDYFFNSRKMFNKNTIKNIYIAKLISYIFFIKYLK